MLGKHSVSCPPNKYSVQKIPKAGLGVIANTKIPAGDIIIREKPFLVVPAEVKSDLYSWWVLVGFSGEIIFRF